MESMSLRRQCWQIQDITLSGLGYCLVHLYIVGRKPPREMGGGMMSKGLRMCKTISTMLTQF